MGIAEAHARTYCEGNVETLVPLQLCLLLW
jgi:hypothetical protein